MIHAENSEMNNSAHVDMHNHQFWRIIKSSRGWRAFRYTCNYNWRKTLPQIRSVIKLPLILCIWRLFTLSCTTIHELNIKHVKENVEKVVQDILEENKGEVNCFYKQTRNNNTPWSTRGKIPVSEFTTQHFVLLAFHIIALVTFTLTGDF